MTPEERELIIDSLKYTANDRRMRAATAKNPDNAHMLIDMAAEGEALAKRFRNFKI